MKNTGIWIDTNQAKIVDWNGRKISTRTVFSGVSRKPKIEGEKSKGTKRGNIGFDYKSRQERRYREDLKKYFRSVINEIADTDNLYLLGPAEAKIGLEREIKEKGKPKANILKVESCDSLTDNQLVDKVLLFFKSRNKQVALPQFKKRRIYPRNR